METKVINISPENVADLIRYNASIQRQSVSLGQIILKMRDVESGLQSLYEFRQSLLNTIVKNAGIDPNLELNVIISPDQKTITISSK